MPGIDYSKWDHVDTSDDECGIEIEENDDGAVVRTSDCRSTQNTASPNVTRFEKPTSVTVSPYKENKCKSNKSVDIGSESAKPKDPVHYKIIPKAGCASEWFAWDQTVDSVECHFLLPKKTKIDVVLDNTNSTDFPGSLTAGDVMAGETGFPAAFGLLVTMKIPENEQTDIPEPFKSVWNSYEASSTQVVLAARFPYPITDVEETWIWAIESKSKWFEDPGSYLTIAVKKKTCSALMGLSVWWSKLFAHHDSITIERPQSASANAFQSVWTEAHKMFREKMKNRQPVDLSSFE